MSVAGDFHPRRNFSRPVAEVVSVARRARILRVVGSLSSLVLLGVALVVIASALDALVRFPSPMRALILVAILALIAIDVRRYVMPAIRFRPSPTDMALRIERSRPELSGWLASAVDFEMSGAASESALAARAVADTDERTRGMRLADVLRPGPALGRLLGAVACAAGIAAIGMFAPDTASIAARRTLLPWTNAAWPARTAVSSLVADGFVAARGKPFALRASLDRGDPERERVRAEYRVSRDGVMGPWIEASMARQPSGVFERLVDVDGDGIEFRFLTSDALSESRSARFVDPASIASSSIVIKPPAYADGVVGTREAELGSGLDARGVLEDPVLEGSSVEFAMQIDRDVKLGGGRSSVRFSQGEAMAELSPVASTGEPVAGEPRLSVESGRDGPIWKLSFTADASTRIEIRLVDEHGITRDAPAVFAFETAADRPPSAAMTLPEQDESVLPDARVDIAAQLRDDLALVQAGVEIVRRIGSDSGDGLVLEERAEISADRVSAEVARLLDLGKLEVSPGDSLELRAFAEDGFGEVPAEGADSDSTNERRSHGRVRSAPRTLRIVGDEEFERQIQTALAGVRRDAMRADERQAGAREAAEASEVDARRREAMEMQGNVTDGVARALESIDQAIERLERNGRSDGALADLAEQARDLAETARRESSSASESLREAADAASEAAQPGASEEQRRAAAEREAGARQEAIERQEEVRAELEDLVQLLDRSEDAWLARRRLEALANRVRQLGRETEQAARDSAGESRDQLPPEARSALDALAERQAQAAQEAEQVVSELAERARALEQSDPMQSEALREAAETAEEGRVREELEQASEETAENRLEQAVQAQERAASALNRAMEELSRDRKVRAKELARLFEDLVESIKRLIQETEALSGEQRQAGAVQDAGLRSQDLERVAMGLGKVSQNARGLAADARARSREAARSARFLDVAAGSLVGAARISRTDPYQREDAEAAVVAALDALESALVEAEEAAERAEDRAEDEKRQELVAKYREFLEKEVGIRTAADAVATDGGKAKGRRELIESRRLGVIQEELRGQVVALREGDEEVQGSDALVEMHATIEESMQDAREQLAQGQVGSALIMTQEAIDAISVIVSALDDSGGPEDEDPFGEQQSGGGEGSGSGGSPAGAVPPLAEIKMLRSMQESLAKRTRAVAESTNGLDPAARLGVIAELAARQQRIVELGSNLARKIAGGSEAGTVKPETTVPDRSPEGEGTPESKEGVSQ